MKNCFKLYQLFLQPRTTLTKHTVLRKRKPISFSGHSQECVRSSKSPSKMDLQECVKRLNDLAPPSLADSWDNVGLLVEPTSPHAVSKLFLTNDLTEDVLDEAIFKNSSMILSYHPPIFKALKRLTMASFKERIIVKAIENRIAIYSPHTAYDVVKDGLTDWLARAPGNGSVEVIKASQSSREYCAPEHQQVDITDLSNSDAISLQKVLSNKCNINTVQFYRQATNGIDSIPELTTVSFACQSSSLSNIIGVVCELNLSKTMRITQLQKAVIPGAGMGRLNTLHAECSLQNIVRNTKQHLGINHLSIAYGRGKDSGSMVKNVAVCAGSGSSVLIGTPADLYITGEMSHHEILEINSQGISVILSNHSNSERAYLKILKTKLDRIFEGKVEVLVSEVDADPLVTV